LQDKASKFVRDKHNVIKLMNEQGKLEDFHGLVAHVHYKYDQASHDILPLNRITKVTGSKDVTGGEKSLVLNEVDKTLRIVAPLVLKKLFENLGNDCAAITEMAEMISEDRDKKECRTILDVMKTKDTKRRREILKELKDFIDWYPKREGWPYNQRFSIYPIAGIFRALEKSFSNPEKKVFYALLSLLETQRICKKQLFPDMSPFLGTDEALSPFAKQHYEIFLTESQTALDKFYEALFSSAKILIPALEESLQNETHSETPAPPSFQDQTLCPSEALGQHNPQRLEAKAQKNEDMFCAIATGFLGQEM